MDTTRFEPAAPEAPPPPTGGQRPPTHLQLPDFGASDTTGRRDSLLMTQPAPAETLGGFNAQPGGPAIPPAKPKRGVLGMHPAAVLAAMVVLHILVVGLVTK